LDFAIQAEVPSAHGLDRDVGRTLTGPPQRKRIVTQGPDNFSARKRPLFLQKFDKLFFQVIPLSNLDGFAKSRKTPFYVIPAEAGIQEYPGVLDSRLSTLRSRATAEDGGGSDGFSDFLRTDQP
jgi:hypothetical protein